MQDKEQTKKTSISSDKVEVKNEQKDNIFWCYIKIYLKECFDSFGEKFAKKLNQTESKLGYPFNSNPKSFDDLTPTIIDNEETYTNALFWAVKNKNIKNIALTGSYGSGKSSILKTFKEKYKQFDYLNISLATFEDVISNINDNPTKEQVLVEKRERDELNQKIELSILQQMLYIERGKTLPNSRFKRIRNLRTRNLFLNTLFVFITVLGYIFLFNRELIFKVCLTYNFFLINQDILEIISGIFLLAGLFFIIKSFAKTFNDFKFSKINLKGDVELNREINDNSILNKNLDEIIYFFERTKYNVVIIEDLDRFKCRLPIFSTVLNYKIYST